jgi:16S rRNA (adenine(1408)-N(1))-methyltransferase
MEIMQGKHTLIIDSTDFAARRSGFARVHIDIGTGDGRYVRHLAQNQPGTFVIGIDACRENLHNGSRHAPQNAPFVIANARHLPPELRGLAAGVTINFPWGSLCNGLLDADAALLDGLQKIMQPNAALEVRLNGGALTEAGWTLDAGAEQVRRVLSENGFTMRRPVAMTAADLKAFPTTWAKSLAFGRDPRAIYLHGVHNR